MTSHSNNWVWTSDTFASVGAPYTPYPTITMPLGQSTIKCPQCGQEGGGTAYDYRGRDRVSGGLPQGFNVVDFCVCENCRNQRNGHSVFIKLESGDIYLWSLESMCWLLWKPRIPNPKKIGGYAIQQ